MALGLMLAPAPAPNLKPGTVATDGDVGPRGIELQRGRGGSFRHRDRVNGFDATIHADGRVTFRNVTRMKRRTNYNPDDDGTVGGMLRGPYDPQPT